MINTDEMRVLADVVEGTGNADLAGVLRDAADEIDAGRNARLVRYRCAALNAMLLAPVPIGVDASPPRVALASENAAHAMLAAERPVKP